MSEEYSRDELISICEAAIVPEDKWSDRDTAEAHRSVGTCWAFLKAGCPFRILGPDEDVMATNDLTIWLRVYPKGFCSFDQDADRDNDLFYLPTRKRLSMTEGRDWY